MKFNDFENFFEYYSGQAHQKQAIKTLYDELEPRLKDDRAEWVRQYRRKIETPSTTSDFTPVRYFSQRDNYRDASRTCFSSSCAMLVEALKPGTLNGPNGDDLYIQKVFQNGDTTEASVQLKTLAEYGIDAKFIQNGSIDLLKSQLDKGVPVPIGILHKGPADAPSGGGHWIIVIAYDDKGFIVHDPWGEIDHASGTYISTNGESRHYSYNLIGKRWTVSNPSDGCAIIV